MSLQRLGSSILKSKGGAGVGGLPNHEWLTLTDAIHWLATGTGKSLNQTLRRPDGQYERARALLEQCRLEAKKADRWPDFKRMHFTAPADVWLSQLEGLGADLPPSGGALLQEVARLASAQQIYEDGFGRAEGQLQQWARSGLIKITGICDERPGLGHIRLEPQYFTYPRDFVINIDNRIRSSSVDTREWSDVHVERKSLVRAARGSRWVPPLTDQGRDNDLSNSDVTGTAVVGGSDRRAKQKLVQKAATTLWPAGIPPELPAGERNKQIVEWCHQKKFGSVSAKTIRRALAPTASDN